MIALPPRIGHALLVDGFCITTLWRQIMHLVIHKCPYAAAPGIDDPFDRAIMMMAGVWIRSRGTGSMFPMVCLIENSRHLSWSIIEPGIQRSIEHTRSTYIDLK